MVAGLATVPLAKLTMAMQSIPLLVTLGGAVRFGERAGS